MKGLRLDIEAPAGGWATVRLTAPDVALEFPASYTPRDSIGDLARVASLWLAGMPDQIVGWNAEPVEYEFRLVTSDGPMRLEVYMFVDARRFRGDAEAPLAVIEGDALTVARAVWRGLRRLQGAMPADEFAAAWRHPFPVAAVEQLGERLRSQAEQTTEGSA